jgi:curli biogenesis system outer membrane secretion channel CsgG
MKTHIIPALLISATVATAACFTVAAQTELGRQQAKTNMLLSQIYVTQVHSYSVQVHADTFPSPHDK